MKIKIKNKETLEELSAMGAGAVSGHVDDREDLEEMYSTSGVMMGAGSGQIPKERKLMNAMFACDIRSKGSKTLNQIDILQKMNKKSQK